MDPITLVMLAVLAVLVLFMFRNNKKRQKDQAELLNKMVPGAEVMTSFGLFGTLLSVNDDTNIAEIAVSEGVVLRVHRQTLSKVVDEDAPAEVEADADTSADADAITATDDVVAPDVDSTPERKKADD
ncbi:preprotein translocase subunit YajC [Salinibacterium sp. ZJ454]|uniref:preprotein translocase subunit YajC n=1 Tax=Salinibacterium sp. ZJ454 TaxID=2708339 RepID=UPI00141D93A2|nr:preprotein translocase subunit YajC [Salinibacterium sp. ZJ454]